MIYTIISTPVWTIQRPFITPGHHGHVSTHHSQHHHCVAAIILSVLRLYVDHSRMILSQLFPFQNNYVTKLLFPMNPCEWSNVHFSKDNFSTGWQCSARADVKTSVNLAKIHSPLVWTPNIYNTLACCNELGRITLN